MNKKGTTNATTKVTKQEKKSFNWLGLIIIIVIGVVALTINILALNSDNPYIRGFARISLMWSIFKFIGFLLLVAIMGLIVYHFQKK
jgi:p-aminobenzoyl-glutamate transporter AbgT